MESAPGWLTAMALVILAALGIVQTIALVSLLAPLKRTSQHLEGVLRRLETDLPATLAEIRDVLRNLNRVAQDVGDATPHLRATLEAIEAVGENVRTATGTVRGLLGYRFIPVAGILAGLRTGLRYAWRLYKRRES
jgi:uncharacterized protein YoxC